LNWDRWQSCACGRILGSLGTGPAQVLVSTVAISVRMRMQPPVVSATGGQQVRVRSLELNGELWGRALMGPY
jgi:hypothetical protein